MSPRLNASMPQRGGFNSEIIYEVTYVEERRQIVKRIGAKKGGFTFHEALELAYDIERYQMELETLGLPVPPIERMDLLTSVREGHTVIVLLSPWAGYDVEHIIEKCHSVRDLQIIEGLVIEMCEILKLLFFKKISDWETAVGIDSKCSNFTLELSSLHTSIRKMWYVDPFPPRYRKPDGQGNFFPVVESPEPKTENARQTLYFKHFDMRGIVLTMTAQLARIKPELKYFFEHVVFNAFGVGGASFQWDDFFQKLGEAPWRKVRDYLAHKNVLPLREIIMSALDQKIFGIDYNIYTLREIGLECAAAQRISLTELEEFFHESHFEDELPKEKKLYLQKKLYDWLEV